MSLGPLLGQIGDGRFPRPRGDEPLEAAITGGLVKFSPPARG